MPFSPGANTALVKIQLFPEAVGNISELQFNVTIVVPDGTAKSHSVVLGEPSIAAVIVPANMGMYDYNCNQICFHTHNGRPHFLQLNDSYTN